MTTPIRLTTRGRRVRTAIEITAALVAGAVLILPLAIYVARAVLIDG